MQSCEPYCGFIKSWIYHARIDDPYGEFFVVYSHTLPDSNVVTTTIDDFSLVLIKVLVLFINFQSVYSFDILLVDILALAC